MNYFKNLNDGTPYEGKLSRTVWSGGKFCDDFKGLPITIGSGDPVRLPGIYYDRPDIHLANPRDVGQKRAVTKLAAALSADCLMECRAICQ